EPVQPPPPAVGGPIVTVRAWLGSLDEGIRVRHPHLYVVRPLAILVYVACTWTLCAVFARALRGSPQRPLDPEPLTFAWLALSLVASAGWAWLQWRDRATLPRSAAVPAAWSFAPTLFAVALLVSPTIVWEKLAYANVRGLISRPDFELVSGTVGGLT